MGARSGCCAVGASPGRVEQSRLVGGGRRGGPAPDASARSRRGGADGFLSPLTPSWAVPVRAISSVPLCKCSDERATLGEQVKRHRLALAAVETALLAIDLLRAARAVSRAMPSTSRDLSDWFIESVVQATAGSDRRRARETVHERSRAPLAATGRNGHLRAEQHDEQYRCTTPAERSGISSSSARCRPRPPGPPSSSLSDSAMPASSCMSRARAALPACHR